MILLGVNDMSLTIQLVLLAVALFILGITIAVIVKAVSIIIYFIKKIRNN